MKHLEIVDTYRRAFLGFRFLGYFWRSDSCAYTEFKLIWGDMRKDEIIDGDREEPIEITIHMN